MDYVAVLTAVQDYILVENVHTGGDGTDGKSCGLLHHGSGTSSNGLDFDGEDAARERLKIPARMKWGSIRRATETRYPSFLGALLDVLPRCIDRTEDNGESIPGYYTQHLKEAIGERAYDSEGHKNAQFLNATDLGPYPGECMRAWTTARDEAMENLGFKA